ncbi:MAG: M23 family metallopeptidase [Longimicrobiales bacterium]
MNSKAHKAIFVTVVGVLSLGAMTVMDTRARSRVDNLESAAVLDPVYALPVERVETHQLELGQTLSVLLMRASLNGSDLAGLLRAIDERQNLRSLASGVEVTVRRWLSNGETRSVDLQLNADTTIRAMRSDSGWSTSLVLTPIVLDTLATSSTISAGQSLYEAIVFDSLAAIPVTDRVGLVSDLASIYEYQLDFTHEIQPGDRFTLVYEREARPDGSARRLRILAARIDNRGKRHDAVLFQRAGLAGYYDLEGRSMRRGFKRYPIDYVRVTSSFAWRRYHPILGIYRAHLGTDFGAAQGTPVKATGDGSVTFAGRDGGYGNVVVIRHTNGYSTRYAHLSRFASGIRPGRRVQMNNVIGYVGATGLATAPHLHYELRLNGRPIDFSRARLPSSPPLPPAYRDEYFALVKNRLVLLQEAVLGAGLARKTADPAMPMGGGS